MANLTIAFSVNTETDADLVRWLAGLPKRGKSEAIRKVIRVGLGRGGVTLGDIYQAVKALDHKLQAGVIVAQVSSGDVAHVDEPPDVAANLDKLGL